jgi:hypothetical protein
MAIAWRKSRESKKSSCALREIIHVWGKHFILSLFGAKWGSLEYNIIYLFFNWNQSYQMMYYYYYKHEFGNFVNCMDMHAMGPTTFSHTKVRRTAGAHFVQILCVPMAPIAFTKLRTVVLCYSWVQSLAQSENLAAVTHPLCAGLCVPRGEIICTWVESFCTK